MEAERRDGQRVKKMPVTVLTQTEIGAILDQISTHTKVGIRDRTAIGMMYRHGIRVGELIGMDREDVDLDRNCFRVRNCKYVSDRTLGLDPIVKTWLITMLEVWGTRFGPLFQTRNGTRVSLQHYHNIMKRAAKRAGIRKRVHPHCLRHSCAAEMCREKVDINIIQRVLGHRSLAVTSGYLDHVEPIALIDTMVRRKEWRN